MNGEKKYIATIKGNGLRAVFSLGCGGSLPAVPEFARPPTQTIGFWS
jgi:hypothetical protein